MFKFLSSFFKNTSEKKDSSIDKHSFIGETPYYLDDDDYNKTWKQADILTVTQIVYLFLECKLPVQEKHQDFKDLNQENRNKALSFRQQITNAIQSKKINTDDEIAPKKKNTLGQQWYESAKLYKSDFYDYLRLIKEENIPDLLIPSHSPISAVNLKISNLQTKITDLENQLKVCEKKWRPAFDYKSQGLDGFYAMIEKYYIINGKPEYNTKIIRKNIKKEFFIPGTIMEDKTLRLQEKYDLSEGVVYSLDTCIVTQEKEEKK